MQIPYHMRSEKRNDIGDAVTFYRRFTLLSYDEDEIRQIEQRIDSLLLRQAQP